MPENRSKPRAKPGPAPIDRSAARSTTFRAVRDPQKMADRYAAERSVSQSLRMMLTEVGPDGRANSRRLADYLLEQALSGNMKAIEIILDRTEGKAHQAITISDPDNVMNHVTVEFVEPSAPIIDMEPDDNG